MVRLDKRSIIGKTKTREKGEDPKEEGAPKAMRGKIKASNQTPRNPHQGKTDHKGTGKPQMRTKSSPTQGYGRTPSMSPWEGYPTKNKPQKPKTNTYQTTSGTTARSDSSEALLQLIAAKATLLTLSKMLKSHQVSFLCLRRMVGPPVGRVQRPPDIPTNPSDSSSQTGVCQTRRGIEPHPNINVRTVQTNNTEDNRTSMTQHKGKWQVKRLPVD